MTVPAGTDRVLVVGISTTQAGTVTAVSYGPQQLTRQLEAAADGARSEIWALAGPNVGSANVRCTVAGGAPDDRRRCDVHGRGPAQPVLPRGALSTQNTSANSASLVLSQTATRDAMFGTIAIANAGNTANLRTSGSVDTVVADARWANDLQGRARRRRHAFGQHRPEHGPERGHQLALELHQPAGAEPVRADADRPARERRRGDRADGHLPDGERASRPTRPRSAAT